MTHLSKSKIRRVAAIGNKCVILRSIATKDLESPGMT